MMRKVLNNLLIIAFMLAAFCNSSFALTKAGTIISNSAEGSYEDKTGTSYKISSNIIQVEVLPIYGLKITPDTQIKNGIPGEIIIVSYQLKNTGNISDKYELNLTNLGGDSADLSDLKLVIDKNQNGVFDVGEPIYNNSNPPLLSINETITLLAIGKIPNNVSSGNIYIKLDGKSKNDNTKEDNNNTATIKINLDGTLKLTKAVNKTTVKPNDTLKFNISFQNIGTLPINGTNIETDFNNDNTPETKTALITFDKIPNYMDYIKNSVSCSPINCIPVFKGENDLYWKNSETDVNGKLLYVGMIIIDNGSGALLSDQAGYLKFDTKVKKTAPNITVTNLAESLYKNKTGKQNPKSNIVFINIQKVIKVVADDTDDNGAYTGSGTPDDPDDSMYIDHGSSGVWLEFKNEVWNLGNTKDTINVELDTSKSQNLPSSYLIKILDDKRTPLIDTNLDGKVDVGEVNPYEKKDIYVQIFIPDGKFSNIVLAIKAISSLNKNIYDYTFDKIGKLESAHVEVQTRVRTDATGGNTIKKEPLKGAELVVYEYDENGKIIRTKKFKTDDKGAIIYDENGNLYPLYNWIRDGYTYRMTTKEYKNNPYYLTPIFKKSYFDSVEQVGAEKCWNENGVEISCNDNSTSKVQIKVTNTNQKLLIIPLDPAGYVFDLNTSQKINGACVTFYKCQTKKCNSFKKVDSNLLDLYPDGITSQENPQLSGDLNSTGQPVGKSNGAFEFRFKNYKSDYDGWYFIEVTFDCGLPALDPTLKNKYKPITKKLETWNPYSGDVYQGELFYINSSFPGAILLRIPLISASIKPLEIEKTASISAVSVGDYIKWTIKVKNPNASQKLYDVSVFDKLPREFKYKKNSSKIDNTPVSDPTILADGTLRWDISVLNPNEEKTITFYTLTVATISGGDRENIAYSSGWLTPTHTAKVGSNTAIAKVKLIKGIFNDRGYIFGRVFIDDNDNRIQDQNEAGLKGVKIYMEDGRYVITDKEGKYHFDNVVPGTHTLKVDKITIPKNGKLKIINNRNSGDPDTVFVDIYPGDIFKANFRFVPEKPSIITSLEPEYQTFNTKYGKIYISREIESVIEDPSTQKLSIINKLYIKNNSVMPIYELSYKEHSPLIPIRGSVYLNKSSFDNPIIEKGRKFKWLLPLIMPNSSVLLKWTSNIPKKESKVIAEVDFQVSPTSETKKINIKVPVILTFVEPKVYKLTVYFEFGKYHLTDDAKRSIENIAKFLRKKDYKKIYISLKSYTDAVRVISSAIGYEKNIELSKKRARAVINYLRSLLIDTKKVEIK